MINDQKPTVRAAGALIAYFSKKGDVTGPFNAEAMGKIIAKETCADELLESLRRLVLAWANQPLLLNQDDGERLEAMAHACHVIGKATGEPYSPNPKVQKAMKERNRQLATTL